MDLNGPSNDLRRYLIRIHLCALRVSVVNVSRRSREIRHWGFTLLRVLRAGFYSFASSIALKLPVESDAEDGDRSAIAIEGWVADELVIEGHMDHFPDWEIVIGFHDFLPAII